MISQQVLQRRAVEHRHARAVSVVVPRRRAAHRHRLLPVLFVIHVCVGCALLGPRQDVAVSVLGLDTPIAVNLLVPIRAAGQDAHHHLAPTQAMLPLKLS